MTSIYVRVCVCVCVCVHVCVVYEDTNVYNDMGMTQLLCHLIMTDEIIFYEKINKFSNTRWTQFLVPLEILMSKISLKYILIFISEGKTYRVVAGDGFVKAICGIFTFVEHVEMKRF